MRRNIRPSRQTKHSLLEMILPFALIAAGMLAYANSFSGVFTFDDEPNILQNPDIRHILPLTDSMSISSPSHGLVRRPVLSLSLVLNYALGDNEIIEILTCARDMRNRFTVLNTVKIDKDLVARIKTQ